MAYRKIYPRTKRGESARTTGQLYLLHLDTPLKHAQHYLGWSSDAVARIDEHRKGTGCNFIRVVGEAGITFTVAWIKDGKTRLDERRMKNRGGLKKYCPICKLKNRSEIEMEKLFVVERVNTKKAEWEPVEFGSFVAAHLSNAQELLHQFQTTYPKLQHRICVYIPVGGLEDMCEDCFVEVKVPGQGGCIECGKELCPQCTETHDCSKVKK